MSAAVQCGEMIEQLYNSMTLHLICLAQALDLRGVKLVGDVSSKLYSQIRESVPFVDHDQALGDKIKTLRDQFYSTSYEGIL